MQISCQFGYILYDKRTFMIADLQSRREQKKNTLTHNENQPKTLKANLR